MTAFQLQELVVPLWNFALNKLLIPIYNNNKVFIKPSVWQPTLLWGLLLSVGVMFIWNLRSTVKQFVTHLLSFWLYRWLHIIVVLLWHSRFQDLHHSETFYRFNGPLNLFLTPLFQL